MKTSKEHGRSLEKKRLRANMFSASDELVPCCRGGGGRVRVLVRVHLFAAFPSRCGCKITLRDSTWGASWLQFKLRNWKRSEVKGKSFVLLLSFAVCFPCKWAGMVVQPLRKEKEKETRESISLCFIQGWVSANNAFVRGRRGSGLWVKEGSGTCMRWAEEACHALGVWCGCALHASVLTSSGRQSNERPRNERKGFVCRRVLLRSDASSLLRCLSQCMPVSKLSHLQPFWS